jgi:hypothetical protein
MKIKVRIEIKPLYETAEIDDDLAARLRQRGEKPEDYAKNVAEERFADGLRDGDAFGLIYKGATFAIESG